MRELSSWEHEQIRLESRKLRRRGLEYYVPLFKRLTAHLGGPPRVLSVGCGIGEDVDALREGGLDACGVDPGFRAADWANRRSLGRLIRADGAHLPFRDGAFDIVLSSGVIEHVGAVGSGLELMPDYHQQRIAYARELVRVTRPGGHIVLDTPNKRFPIDAWHGPFGLWGRWHSPRERFLVSYGEVRDLFLRHAGAARIEALGLRRFFVFGNVKARALGAPAALAARAFFRLADCPGLKWLRRSPLMPYLVLNITR